MKNYDHGKIEKKWQKAWEKSGIYEAKDNSKKPKFYSLIEFPFPSGDGMHTGHLRSNTAMDIISRKRRAEGFNVLYPIGWDAFGLPTENFALKTGIHPAVVSKKNTDNFRRQLKSAGFSFDWSREIDTTNPEYYRWTQWIFQQMFKKGLAYKKKMFINWCPKDKTGLANEEVVDGKCERCGTPVEKREKEQWMLAITKYADRLDKDLDTVDYLEKIKIQQRNWIGKSEGAEFDFAVSGTDKSIKIFTTRPDTIFGVTYVVLAPEHPLVEMLLPKTRNKFEVTTYISEVVKKSNIDRSALGKEKTGVVMEGVRAVNPATNEEVPVWIADYVLGDYGTGAVMAVPAHDERDYEFAQKYNLPVKEVIEPLFIKKGGEDGIREGQSFKKRHAAVAIVKHWSENKYLCLKWKQTDWRGFVIGGLEEGENAAETAIREVAEETGYQSARFVRNLGGIVHAQFFHKVKNENRWAYFHPVYLELKDGTRKEIADEEKKIHDIMWMDKKEVDEFLDWVTDMRLIWSRVLNPDAFPGKSGLHESSRVEEQGILTKSGEFSGMIAEEAKRKIAEKYGKVVTTYKLRDWVFSRQRYWGEPIPMVFCEHCKAEAHKKGGEQTENAGWVPVPEKDLPVVLPNVKKYEPTDTGESPLAAISKWVNTKCPVCGGPAKRETDTMPNWAGSSWYFLRYADPKNKKALADPKKIKYWQPVDWYNGGMEHTTLHLLYSRFWNKFLFDIGVVPTSEPYQKRTSHGFILAANGEKMSKSRGNVVNPDQIIETFGADTLRVYEMFMGPFDQMVSWNTDSIVGSRRFIERVWRLLEKVEKKPATKKKNQTTEKVGHTVDLRLESTLNATIKKVSEDIEAMRFNTAISSLMILVNEYDRAEVISQSDYESLLLLLAPFAPHVTEELWSLLGNKTSINLAAWPQYDESRIKSVEITIAVSINGKVRAEMAVEAGTSEEKIREKALSLGAVEKWTKGKGIKKVIYVKDKLINIVVDSV